MTAEARPSAETTHTPYLATFDVEDRLYAYLDRLNQDGHLCELAAIDRHGVAFVATLTDPDADRVHHVVTDESGYGHACQEWCDEFSPCRWRPTYPVVALSEQDPNVVWAEVCKAEEEELDRHMARIAAAQAERGLPPGEVQS